MTIADLARKIGTQAVRNSPSILTGFGVTGLVATAVLAARGAVNADHVLSDAGEHRAPLKRKLELTWQDYAPAVVVGGVSVACIIGANHVSTRRNAALVTAYSLTEKAFTEYKHKVRETLGEAKEEKVRDAIAQDRMRENPPGDIVMMTGKDVLCYEMLSGRYFMSDMETLKKAQNTVNAQLINDRYASLNDFYREAGLTVTGMGEELGWTSDALVELKFSPLMSEDGRPCICVGYDKLPVADYFKFS